MCTCTPATFWIMVANSWMQTPAGVAVECGWIVREVGRQPWSVYGVPRTSDAASDDATMLFMLRGIALVFPIMIGYNLYQDYVFRGRVGLSH
jgi:cytochrome bd-type quinol oxidase subunit 1